MLCEDGWLYISYKLITKALPCMSRRGSIYLQILC